MLTIVKILYVNKSLKFKYENQVYDFNILKLDLPECYDYKHHKFVATM